MQIVLYIVYYLVCASFHLFRNFVRDIEGAVKVGERISYIALVFKGKPNSYNHMVFETLMYTEYLCTVCTYSTQ